MITLLMWSIYIYMYSLSVLLGFRLQYTAVAKQNKKQFSVNMAHHLPMKVSFLFPSYFQVMSQRQDSLTFRWCPEGRTPLLSGDAPKAGLPYFQGMSRIHCIMAQLKVPSFTVAGLLYFQVMSPCCIMAQLKVPSFTAARVPTVCNRPQRDNAASRLLPC